MVVAAAVVEPFEAGPKTYLWALSIYQALITTVVEVRPRDLRFLVAELFLTTLIGTVFESVKTSALQQQAPLTLEMSKIESAAVTVTFQCSPRTVTTAALFAAELGLQPQVPSVLATSCEWTFAVTVTFPNDRKTATTVVLSAAEMALKTQVPGTLGTSAVVLLAELARRLSTSRIECVAAALFGAVKSWLLSSCDKKAIPTMLYGSMVMSMSIAVMELPL